MAAGPTTMRIAALGDLHVGESPGDALPQLLSGLNDKADVLILCGDLTDHGVPREAEAVTEALAACRIPVVAVLGNHDWEAGRQDEIKGILSRRGVMVLDGEPCAVRGVAFAGTKGFAGGFDNHVLQPWGEEVVKQFVQQAVTEAIRLERALARLRTEPATGHVVVVLHYAPIHQTVVGEPPEIIPFLGSSRLVDPIDRFGAVAVFHGHAHHGSPEGRTPRGIPVYNVSLPVRRRVHPDRPYAVLEL
jgi:Icc-related predicted phosphoesterase